MTLSIVPEPAPEPMSTEVSSREALPLRKPYWDIPILESHEPLVAIPSEAFIYADPHPYAQLGAPYGDASPFFVRQAVCIALEQAQQLLQRLDSAWQLFIFDAYRPVVVQQFMVEYTFEQALQDRQLERDLLSSDQANALWQEVFQMWAPPSLDPATPPPHSTGAAVDITIFDTTAHQTIWMGSPIDELSERSHPDYFRTVAADETRTAAERAEAALAHTHRQQLKAAMADAGFERHPGEWWHFSLGDQMWAWLNKQKQPRLDWTARYGRV